MNSLALSSHIPPTGVDSLAKIIELERFMKRQPQKELKYISTLHAGVYTRTVIAPAGLALTGSLMKTDTTLIISGDIRMRGEGGDSVVLRGYNVLTASAGRKQIVVTLSEVNITMVFKTDAHTIAEAEAEFTDDVGALNSKRAGASNLIADERSETCQVS
jgi:hypothetical protein